MSARGPDPERRALDARVVAWTREEPWAPDEARFDALALELFAFQYERCAPFARFCEVDQGAIQQLFCLLLLLL